MAGQSGVAEKISAAIDALDAARGGRVLITGGPTCEDIDAVRFITNRSTGRMGIETALAAKELGLAPLLIMGPGAAVVPDAIACVRVRSAAEMLAAVEAGFHWCDYLVMTAAVADYTPLEYTDKKLKKSEGELVIRLKRTADILLTISSRPERGAKKIAGFSLDASMNLAEGRRKLESKNLDLIAVNSVSAFAAESSTVVLITRGGVEKEINSTGKRDIAKEILSQLIS